MKFEVTGYQTPDAENYHILSNNETLMYEQI